MKIIFLDIDGVVTSQRTGWHNMDVSTVNFIRWICKQSGYKIVISSTWRLVSTDNFWFNIFDKDNIADDWNTDKNSDKRKNIYLAYGRGFEIKKYLNTHPEVTDYLIIDDDTNMLDEQIPFCVFTDPIDGMLFKHQEEIKKKLNITTIYKQNFEMPYINNLMFGIYNTKERKYDT